ncbi:dUTP diphosphatase, partial [Faecalibaculum rodentium]
MTNQEMVLDMLERQHKYDRAIEKAHEIQISALGSDRLKAALLDEVGELNHAMKSRWCWWKKSQEPVDRKQVLE